MTSYLPASGERRWVSWDSEELKALVPEVDFRRLLAKGTTYRMQLTPLKFPLLRKRRGRFYEV
jgi:hypothetical protein